MPDLYFVFRRNESLAQSVWIGLYQTTNNHSSLKWIDDTPFVFGDTGYFQNWYPDEPNNPVNQKCVYIAPGHFLWGDVDCRASLLAMCEAPCEYFKIITAHKRSLRQGNVFTGVCLSTRGVSVPACIAGHKTRGPCPGGVSVQGRSLVLGGGLSRRVCDRETPSYGNKRAARILLECILVCKKQFLCII